VTVYGLCPIFGQQVSSYLACSRIEQSALLCTKIAPTQATRCGVGELSNSVLLDVRQRLSPVIDLLTEHICQITRTEAIRGIDT